MVLQSGYNADKPIQRDQDVPLTAHFGLFELSVTSNAALQKENRLLSDTQVQKLSRLARHCETMRRLCGDRQLVIHSGYRSPGLNGATVGSSSTSQHPRCEAVDFHVEGQDLEETFTLLRAAAAAGRFMFGQLIIEQAQRSYGTIRWIHCSVIGTLDHAKVGQVLRMVAGADGVSAYSLVEKMEFNP